MIIGDGNVCAAGRRWNNETEGEKTIIILRVYVWVFLRGQRSGRRRHQHNHSITWRSLFVHFLGIRPHWYYDVLATCCGRSKRTAIAVIVNVISQTIKRRQQFNIVRSGAVWDKSPFGGRKVSLQTLWQNAAALMSRVYLFMVCVFVLLLPSRAFNSCYLFMVCVVVAF